jgi:hypothetical protein
VLAAAVADHEDFHASISALWKTACVSSELFDHVEQLLHALGVLAVQFDRVLGTHRDFGDFGLQAGAFERRLHRLEPGRRAEHLDRAVVIGDHVVGAGFERDLHDLVLARAGREHELPDVLELERHRPFGAHVAAVLAECVAHLGHGAHAVVGHAVDDDRGAADAVALVADFLVAHAFEVAGGLVDVLLDRVGGHVRCLGLVDRQPQARVHRQVAATLARGHGDFTDDAGPDLASLLVLTAFAMLDVGPLGMTGHEAPSDCRSCC